MARNICIPIDDNRGLLSPVAPSFERAPAFLLVDASTLAYHAIANAQPGTGCHPCRVLPDVPIDAFIVRDIDPLALDEISRRRILVYQAPRGNVADALASHIAGKLAAVPGAERVPDGL